MRHPRDSASIRLRLARYAGDARAAAEALAVHRATLYYRLQRAEQLGGIDLSDGAERLALHLGIKLARLLGLVGEHAGG